MRIRYSKQHDSYSCGPNAVFNAMKWDGRSGSWREAKPKLVKKTKCGPPPRGTNPYDLHLVLKKKFKAHRVAYRRKPKFKNFDFALKHGCLLIIEFMWPKWTGLKGSGHYFLIDEKTSKGYWTINLRSGGPARQWVSKKKMRKLLSLRKEAGAWLILPKGLHKKLTRAKKKNKKASTAQLLAEITNEQSKAFTQVGW